MIGSVTSSIPQHVQLARQLECNGVFPQFYRSREKDDPSYKSMAPSSVSALRCTSTVTVPAAPKTAVPLLKKALKQRSLATTQKKPNILALYKILQRNSTYSKSAT